MKEVPGKELIFIDESGVDLALLRLYDRAKKGKRCQGSKPLRREKRVSILGAIGLENVWVCHPLLGSVDRITFEAFIVTKVLLNLKKGMKILMDNARIHQGEIVRDCIKKREQS